MKIYVLILLAVFLILDVTTSEFQKANIVSVKHEKGVGGVWKSKVQWKTHWVRYWEVKKMYVPIWKKVWSPVEIREWLPLPKPPMIA